MNGELCGFYVCDYTRTTGPGRLIMLHITKLAVGVRDIDHLREVQAMRMREHPPLRHRTRNFPRRRSEVIDGGSIYWVIAGTMMARQRILDIVEDQRDDLSACTSFLLDSDLVPLIGRPTRPFQGWRYLDSDAAPADLTSFGVIGGLETFLPRFATNCGCYACFEANLGTRIPRSWPVTQVHVIGAGLAGLAAALTLTANGRSVVVHEAGPAAGGRCRSYFDHQLGLRIDNGNHLLLSGNTAARAYIAETGADALFRRPRHAAFPFMDIKTRERWTVRLNDGRVPWWMLRPNRRVPGTRLSDYWQMAQIIRIRDDTSVADSMRPGPLYRRLLEPLAIAALNTPPRQGLARLLAAVMRETLARGGAACIPMLPKQGLTEALVDPAIATLQARGAAIRFNGRIAALTGEGGRITALLGSDGLVPIGAAGCIVLAVPPWVAADLLPGLVAPDAFQAILNIHFRHTAEPTGSIQESGLIGLTSGTAEWVFAKPGHVSVTISAANRMADDPAPAIAQAVWPDVVDALGLDSSLKQTVPAYRVVKEKRATFAATAEQEQRRPMTRTPLASNLALAGDWTATGLPATIEGAIRSGRSAAQAILSF